MKFSFYPATLSLLLLSTSCSWYRNLERSLIEDDEKQANKSSRRGPVSREQYDQLLVKYEDLAKKYEELKENKAPAKSSLVDELQSSQTENFAQTSPNVETETVNLFPNQAQPPAPGQAQPAVVPVPTQSSSTADVSASVESQLNLYRRGLALKASNPGEATKIFQQLEQQGAPAVKVRAKLQVGELLFAKQQFDLALQVFEDIINKSSYSGVVLDALRYAVVCSDKLGIPNKKDQYASMLNDVFETN